MSHIQLRCIVCSASAITGDQLCARCAYAGGQLAGPAVAQVTVVDCAGAPIQNHGAVAAALKEVGWPEMAEAIDASRGVWLVELPGTVADRLEQVGRIEFRSGRTVMRVEIP